MRIRRAHPIRDRIKLIFILLLVLGAVANVVQMVNDNRECIKTATIDKLIKTALEPVGSTMYIWGGGWNVEDSGSGKNSMQLGLNETWAEFAKQQDADYDYENHRYERENGLDCSGFVGWVLYNTFETQEGKAGYVTTSTDMAESLAQRGWGKLIKNPKKFLPGDIVSMEGHVWICLGTCEDGSVLLVHSSPPGVSVCGTLLPGNAEKSQAEILATEYMTKQHLNWQEKYPNRKVDAVYLENVVLFRWSSSVMLDAEELQEKSAEEIMEILRIS